MPGTTFASLAYKLVQKTKIGLVTSLIFFRNGEIFSGDLNVNHFRLWLCRIGHFEVDIVASKSYGLGVLLELYNRD